MLDEEQGRFAANHSRSKARHVAGERHFLYGCD